MARRPFSRSLPSKAALPLSCLSLHALLHGHRPSEAVAIRVRSLALGSGTLFVERSRSLGAEAAPKTAAAARVVRLTPWSSRKSTPAVSNRRSLPLRCPFEG